MSKSILKAFSERLHVVCDDLQIPRERGRESQFAKLFKVTPNAARKWLRAQGMPELSRAIEICVRADVSVIWLLQGIGEKKAADAASQNSALTGAIGMLPPSARADVVEFVRYKIERSAPLIAREDRVRALDALASAGVEETHLTT